MDRSVLLIGPMKIVDWFSVDPYAWAMWVGGGIGSTSGSFSSKAGILKIEWQYLRVIGRHILDLVGKKRVHRRLKIKGTVRLKQ